MSNGGPNGGGSATVYGAETHTQIVGEIAAHSHGVTDPGHSHSVGDAVSWTYGSDAAINGSDNGRSDIYQTGVAYTGISINTTGSSSPMNIMNPFAVVNYIIRYQ
jgi:microcystin-dependent protein